MITFCRTCLSPVNDTECISLNSDDPQPARLRKILQLCVQQLNLKRVTDPVICQICQEKVEDNFKFIRQCLEIEEKIYKHLRNSRSDITCIEIGDLMREKIEDTEHVIVEPKENLHADGKFTLVQDVCVILDDCLLSADEVPNNELTLGCDTADNLDDQTLQYVVSDEAVVAPGDGIAQFETLQAACLKRKRNANCVNVTDENWESNTKIPNNWRMCFMRAAQNTNTCRVCKLDYASRPEHLEHVYACIRDLPYKCCMCDFTTNIDARFYLHTKAHAKKKRPLKRKQHLKLTRLIYSRIICITRNRTVCAICGTKCPSRKDLLAHIYSELRQKNSYKCCKCGFETTDDVAYVEHTRTHVVRVPAYQLPCKICGQSFVSLGQCKTHMHKHFLKYTCKVCTYRAPHVMTLIRHNRSHKNSFPHTCKYCTHVIGSEEALIAHLKKIHKKCYLCEFEWSSKDEMQVHMQTHKNIRPFKCDTCDYATFTNHFLELHKRTHTGYKPYMCESCGYRSRTCTQLRNHQLIKHVTAPKRHMCSVCGFVTRRSTYLTKHMRTHTGEKRYECKICGLKCSTSFSLKRHMRRHTGETPYKCDFCDYSAIRYEAVDMHLRATHFQS